MSKARFMNIDCKKVIIFTMSFLLLSCSKNYPVCNVANRYKDFVSMKAAFDKGTKQYRKEDCIATVFDLKEITVFKDFEDSYYISGLCGDKNKQPNFDDICLNIIPARATIFLIGEGLDVFVTFKSSDTIVSYSSINFSLFEDEDDELASREFDESTYMLKCDSEDIKRYYFPEYRSFLYEKEETNASLRDRFRIMSSGKNQAIFGSIVFSKRASLENVEKYSTLIKDFIVTKTNS